MFRFISLADVASYVNDGDTIAINSFLALANPGELQETIADSFENTGHPAALQILTPAGCGCWDENRLIDRCASLGMIKTIFASHFSTMPRIAKMIANNQLEAYNFPLGVITTAIRAAAAGMDGLLSKTGLGIFVDPRQNGPGMNEKSQRSFVKAVTLDGEDFLYYRTPKIDVAFIRGTSVDAKGNIDFENECVTADALIMAQAAKANGGKVIVQVESVRHDFVRPRNVIVPGILVDAVVVTKSSLGLVDEKDNQALSGAIHVPASHMEYWMDKISQAHAGDKDRRELAHCLICQRAAEELQVGDIVNLGIGMPELVGKYASEKGILRDITLTVESGGIGGLPLPAKAFGSMIGADYICDMVQQFDYYDGGGLDICFMGALEIDRYGNVNSHYLPGKSIGIGGFANITQSTKTVVFCLTFMTKGLKYSFDDEGLHIIEEGQQCKFKNNIAQISFSAKNALAKGQNVLYITERGVFKLTQDGLALVELQKGIDKQSQIIDILDFDILDLT